MPVGDELDPKINRLENQNGNAVRLLGRISQCESHVYRTLSGSGSEPSRGRVCSHTTGCLATRNWVNDRLRPSRASKQQLETQVNNLHLERKLVLDSSTGPTFASGSASLSPNAKREIDAFLEDMDGPAASEPAAAGYRVFVIAGYTDSVGHEAYNYESDSGALPVSPDTGRPKGPRPDEVRVVSYGADKPVDDNSSPSGRRKNRRVEILVYQEKIAS